MTLDRGFLFQTHHKRHTRSMARLSTLRRFSNQDWATHGASGVPIEWKSREKAQRRVLETFTYFRSASDSSAWPNPSFLDLAQGRRHLASELAPFKDRLAEIYQASLEEGVELNARSIDGLINFIKVSMASSVPAIMVRPNGNVRALWVAENQQIGIQFTASNTCQYVLFSESEDYGISNHYGECAHEEIISIISAIGLVDLLWH